jgi:electron transport complex protein RnfG
MKDSVKMVAALVVFATVACVGLAVVYDKTKPVIEENTQKKTKAAQEELFPDADSFETITGKIASPSGVAFGEEFAAKKGNSIIGVVINASSEGFNGPVTALVGVSADGKITGVNILVNTETPGLGLHASNPSYYVDKPAKTKTFYGQFTGKSTNSKLSVDKDGGEIIAITAATITSRAVTKLVAAALESGAQWLSANGGNE